MTTPIILYHYNASPYAWKVRKALGIKGLAWQSVKTPVTLPKPDLVRMTGGYRGVPVMQTGADIFIDSGLILAELEARWPEPTLYPNGNSGLPQGLAFWTANWFTTCFQLLAAKIGDKFPDDFKADRKAMFPTIDIDTLAAGAEPFGARGAQAAAEFRAHAALVNEQLADGRDFLQGPRPSRADIEAGFPLVFVGRVMGDLAWLIKGLDHLAPWFERLEALGEGDRTDLPAEDARRTAAEATPAETGFDADDPVDIAPGTPVVVKATDAKRGEVAGEIVGLDVARMSVRRQAEGVGDVVVHFPRAGFRLHAR